MKLAKLSDIELVWLAQGGSDTAFTEVLARHDGVAFRVAMSVLRDSRSDAEDAMQNARLTCWESIQSYDAERGEFGDWYLEIVRRCCHKVYKRRQRTADWAAHDDVEEVLTSPLEQLVDKDARSYLSGAVDVLPTRQAQVVRMHFLEHRDYPEIAAEMGISEVTVSRHANLGLKNLRDRLGDKWEKWAPEGWGGAR